MTLCNRINIFSPTTNARKNSNASQNWLQEARPVAQKQKKYNSADTRRGMRALRFGSAPYNWQLDLLATLDADEKNNRERENLARREAKKQETVHLREAK